MGHPSDRLNLAATAAREAIQTRYGNTLRLTMLASEHGVHPTSLCQAYRRIFGTTFYTDLTDHRIKIAKQLLAEGTKVIAVAHLVGYGASKKNFFRVWRKHVKCSPGDWQRENRSETAK